LCSDPRARNWQSCAKFTAKHLAILSPDKKMARPQRGAPHMQATTVYPLTVADQNPVFRGKNLFQLA